MAPSSYVRETTQLIDLAVDDLDCASILYASRKYRNSFYFFQQAVEKANKAFGLHSGIISKEQLKKNIGHTPIKIYEQIVKLQHQKLTTFTNLFSKFPTTYDWFEEPINDDIQFEEFEGFVKKFKGSNIAIISLAEIDHVLGQLYLLQDERFRMPSVETENVVGVIGKFLVEASGIPPEDRQNVLNVLQIQFTEDPSQFASLMKDICRMLNAIIFPIITFSVFAALYNQHGVKPRYFDEGFDPIKTYNKKFPLIRRQSELMDVFQVALKKFKRLVTQKQT